MSQTGIILLARCFVFMDQKYTVRPMDPMGSETLVGGFNPFEKY